MTTYQKCKRAVYVSNLWMFEYTYVLCMYKYVLRLFTHQSFLILNPESIILCFFYCTENIRLQHPISKVQSWHVPKPPHSSVPPESVRQNKASTAVLVRFSHLIYWNKTKRGRFGSGERNPCEQPTLVRVTISGAYIFKFSQVVTWYFCFKKKCQSSRRFVIFFIAFILLLNVVLKIKSINHYLKDTRNLTSMPIWTPKTRQLTS